MFAGICAMVLLTMARDACSVPAAAYGSNPFLQAYGTSKLPLHTPNQPVAQSDLYVVLPSSGQQLQHVPPTTQPSALTGNHVHSLDCSHKTSSFAHGLQKPIAAAHVEKPSNWNLNVVNVAQITNVNNAQLNRRCLKSTGLFLGTSCNKFVSCLNGTATELNCPDGLLFNADGLYCDRPENVQCDGQKSAATGQYHVALSSSTTGSPIHASLTQFSPVPPQQIGQTGEGTSLHISSQIHSSNTQHQHQHHQQNQQSQQQHQHHQQNQQSQQQHQHHQQQQFQQTEYQYQNQQHQHAQQHQHQHNEKHQYHHQQQQHEQQYQQHHQHHNSQNSHLQSVNYQDLQQQHQQNQQQVATNQVSQNQEVFGIIQQQGSQGASGNLNALLQTNELPITDDSQLPAIGTRCLTLRGQFPSNDCNTFLNCWAGIATEQTCPDGLLFSTKGYCDYPENVNCAGRRLIATQAVVTFPPESKTPPPSTIAQPSSTPTVILTFPVNPTTQSPPTTVAVPGVPAPHLKSRCLTARGQFPSSTCNKFVNCWDDVILEQECPEGFLFSTKGYCDYSHNVRCGDRPTDSRGSKSECLLENGTFRDKNKCSSYLTCIGNKVVARYDCPEGLNYNDYAGVCDYAYRVDCSKDPLLIPGRSNVPQLRRGDQCPADFATYRDVNNCGIYYTCVSRTVVATYECPVGFSFNDEIGVCDYTERVDCTKAPKIFQVPENVIPEITDEMKQKMETCKPGTMFSLNPQCTAVCLCKTGVAEIVQCPAGLAYDSKLDKCILPHLAKC